MHEDCISFYLNNPAAWDVKAGLRRRVVRNQLTGDCTAAPPERSFVSPSGGGDRGDRHGVVQAAIDQRMDSVVGSGLDRLFQGSKSTSAPVLHCV